MTDKSHIEQLTDDSSTAKTLPSRPKQDTQARDSEAGNTIFALVIEDDPDAAFIYKKALMDNDYRVEHISHGGDAQEALRTMRPNIILLDMHLPEVNGITLLNQIRSTEGMEATPIILTTADHSIASTVEDEVNMVLLKPVTYSQVKNLVSRIIKREYR